MTKNLDTLAEQLAIQAEDFPAFGGLKLLHIKREVALILEMIGRNGIFDEYTRHDISHIDEMLRILDWLVPEKTRREMSPADWLLVVLSIYFHDLGLLVTKDEYDGRSLSSFGRFCEDQLFSGPDGEDYRSNVVEQYPDAEQRERFLYQEFVRYNHPQRVASWIVGSTSAELGVSKKVTAEVSRLLRQLDPKFRQDLAIVCESHHLNDLNDLKKYRLSEPYGNSMSETANLQYAAVLLRTADLLHMTRDRTPSIAFRVINPSDPKSQTEWAKQMAVRSVRPQLGIGSDGLPSKLAERTIVEVHASFTNAEGFFGLTSYLGYCTQQLKKSHEWVESSKKLGQPDFDFPWRGIDDSHVEASGFIPHPFSFELDQAKILDLLTGHTLYNDTGVVLRELVQNALDAVRLQKLTTEGNSGADYTGEIRISWNST
ncbi:MAG TPA: hypothetical protein VK399_11275, partial [Longimicrobiaceae bacterium]|nr:hypothetical protein [Longimicrobiaceae bacterium]